jgi:DNA-binding transcriptional ArsR family regulator
MRTAMLMLVAVLDETYPAELARYLGFSISSVQRTLDKIEEERLIASRPVVVRAVTLNPLYPAAKELRALLLRLAEGYPEYQRIKESRRLRPRRRNKPLRSLKSRRSPMSVSPLLPLSMHTVYPQSSPAALRPRCMLRTTMHPSMRTSSSSTTMRFATPRLPYVRSASSVSGDRASSAIRSRNSRSTSRKVHFP